MEAMPTRTMRRTRPCLLPQARRLRNEERLRKKRTRKAKKKRARETKKRIRRMPKKRREKLQPIWHRTRHYAWVFFFVLSEFVSVFAGCVLCVCVSVCVTLLVDRMLLLKRMHVLQTGC